MGDILMTAEQVLNGIHAAAPEIEAILPLIPSIGTQAMVVAKLADDIDVAIAAALVRIAQVNGTSPLAAIPEFVDHITAGAPNSPALNALTSA